MFTRALLDGLDGAADELGDGNGTIDIVELIGFATRRVREAEGGQKVTTPRVDRGEAFPIARKPRSR